jgi:dTDP-4-dehydrorhamnose 3,5-epimerase
MILGLWDVRENSTTKDLKMRIVMGNGTSKLVYVPRGVAHGVINVAHKNGTIIYFVNQRYNINEPDEYRLAWDKAGEKFWEIEKG